MKKISLTKNEKYVIYAKKDLVLMMIIKSIIKSEIIVTIQESNRGVAHTIWNLRCKRSKEIPIRFHNDSTYDNHFIIKELAKEFDGQLEYLGVNTKNIKHKTIHLLKNHIYSKSDAFRE